MEGDTCAYVKPCQQILSATAFALQTVSTRQKSLTL